MTSWPRPVRQPGIDRPQGRVRRPGPLRSFRPLPSTRTTRRSRSTSSEIEPAELGDAHPSRVQQLEDRDVPAPPPVRRTPRRRRSPLASMLRRVGRAPGWAAARVRSWASWSAAAGSTVIRPDSCGPGEEHPDRSGPALQGAPRLARGLLLGQPAAQRTQRDVAQIVDPEPVEMDQQPDQVGPVGAHGMRRNATPRPSGAAVRASTVANAAGSLLGHASTVRHRPRHPGAHVISIRRVQVIIGGYTAEMDGTAAGVRSLVVERRRAGAVQLDEVTDLALPSPSYLIAHPDRPWLFAVTEGTPSLAAQPGARERTAGSSLLTSRESGGDFGCHLALAPDGRHLVVAHYGSGSVGQLRRRRGWGAEPRSPDLDDVRRHRPGSRAAGPARTRIRCVFDRDELLVADLGTDQIHRLAVGRRRPFRTRRRTDRVAARDRDRGISCSSGLPHRRLRAVGAAVAGPARADDGWTERQTRAELDGQMPPTRSPPRRSGPTGTPLRGQPGRRHGRSPDPRPARRPAEPGRPSSAAAGRRRATCRALPDGLIWVANQTNDLVSGLRPDRAAAGAGAPSSSPRQVRPRSCWSAMSVAGRGATAGPSTTCRPAAPYGRSPAGAPR